MGITSNSQGYGEARLRRCMRCALLAWRLCRGWRREGIHYAVTLAYSPSTHFPLLLLPTASFQGCFMNMQLHATGVLIVSVFAQKFTCPTQGVSRFFAIKGQLVNILGFEQQMVSAIPQLCHHGGKAASDNECGCVPINFIHGNLRLIFISFSHVMK